jgi:Asp/Glu/hydantoin racemase
MNEKTTTILTSEKNLKYRIQEIMEEKFTKKNYDNTKRDIMRLLQWSDSSWRRNVRAKKSTTISITSDDLRLIALTIGCSMDELFND